VFFLRFPAANATHILRVNCAKITGDGPGQRAYDIYFSIERTFSKI